MSRIYMLREIEAIRLGISRGFFPAQTMSFGCSDDGKGRSVQIYVDGDGVPYRYCGSTGDNRPVIEDIGMKNPRGQALSDYLKRRGDFKENPYELNDCNRMN